MDYYDALKKTMQFKDYTDFLKLVVSEKIRMLDKYLEVIE